MESVEDGSEICGTSDEEILSTALGEKPLEVTSHNAQAGAESCLIIISVIRSGLKIDDPVPDHIKKMWSESYIKIAEKYDYDPLAQWGPEISMLLATMLLIQDTVKRLPEPEPEPETNPIHEDVIRQ